MSSRKPFHALAVERIVAAIVVAVVLFAGADLSGVVILVAIDVVLFVALVAEHLRIERPGTAPDTTDDVSARTT